MKTSPSDQRRKERRWLARNGHALACSTASKQARGHQPLHKSRREIMFAVNFTGHPMFQ
jgi:hypothetical protein